MTKKGQPQEPPKPPGRLARAFGVGRPLPPGQAAANSRMVARADKKESEKKRLGEDNPHIINAKKAAQKSKQERRS